MSALCLTLAEQSLPLLDDKIRSYAGRVSLIEVRLDYLSDPLQLPRLGRTPTRFIATCRPREEGGRYEGPETERRRILRRAAGAGFTWIDLEADAEYDSSAFRDVSVIRSYHDFSGCPSDLTERYAAMENLPGQAVKLAVTPADGSEAVELLRWMETLPADSQKVILGMGKAGRPTRVLSPLLGSLWTYVVEDDVHSVAPGQFTFHQAADILRFESWMRLGRRLPFYGVLTTSEICFRICRILNRLFEQDDLEAFALPLAVDVMAPWLDYLFGSPLNIQGLALTGSLARGTLEGRVASAGGERIMDNFRRGGKGWQGDVTGVAFDLPESSLESESRYWAEWLARQYQFWTEKSVDRRLVQAMIDQDAER